MTVAARASLTVALIATSATVLHFHHRTPTSSATSAAPTGTVRSLVREPVPPRRRTPVRVSRRHTRPALAVVAAPSRYADVTEYCATGNRNAAGRWPELGDVAVMDRSIPFGTRVLIDGNVYTVRDWIGWGSDFDIYGGGAGCEQRAVNFGRRHLRVVVEP